MMLAIKLILLINLNLYLCYCLAEKNPFNDKSFIVYRPQTPVVANIGQEKTGGCPIVKTAPGFTFDQVN